MVAAISNWKQIPVGCNLDVALLHEIAYRCDNGRDNCDAADQRGTNSICDWTKDINLSMRLSFTQLHAFWKHLLIHASSKVVYISICCRICNLTTITSVKVRVRVLG